MEPCEQRLLILCRIKLFNTVIATPAAIAGTLASVQIV
jgi:hypothetical protein